MHVDDWHGAYRQGWGKNRLRPASFAHPAKNSYGLSVRIYEHALEEGWVKPGDYLIDIFAGIGGFALEAMRHGLNFVGVELEQRFVDMGQGCDCTGISKADWARFQGRWGKARYKDGRHWCPECVMKAGIVGDERKFKPLPLPGTKWAALAKTRQATLFDAAPTASYVRGSGKIPCTEAHHYRGNIETWAAQGMPGTAVIVQGDSRRLGEVLERAQLCLSSPPFSTSLGSRAGGGGCLNPANKEKYKSTGMANWKWGQSDYGQTEGNLGNLPDTGFEAALEAGAETERAQACISSPPFENVVNTKDQKYVEEKRLFGDYGDTVGQLGQQQGSTFWAASRQILEEVYKILAPGAHAIWVVKMFVRNKKLVDFPGQWESLCQSVGFRTVCKHRAWLNKNSGIVQTTLDGDEVSMEKWFKSFFRRLCESKGSPRIDWELVLCMEKPQ